MVVIEPEQPRHSRHQRSINIDASLKGDRISWSCQAVQHPRRLWLFPAMDRHAEWGIVHKGADEGGEDRKLRQRLAIRNVSNAGEGRIVNEWNICLSALARLLDDSSVLNTIVSGNEALGSELLRRCFGTVWKQQHVPVAVPHIERSRRKEVHGEGWW